MLYGPGSGAGVGGPQWLNGIASALRDMSNSVRRAFSDLMDGTLGQLGNVGQFIGGMLKRAFDYGLMLTPAGFAVYEEEVSGMGSMMVMVADAVYSPDPERYNRLGQMLTMLPEAFAQMSAGEWGSMTVDVIVGIFTGEAGEAEAAERMGLRAMLRSMGKGLKRIGGAESREMMMAAREVGRAITGAGEEINQATIMRALRQSGSIEGQATAKLLKRGVTKLVLESADPTGLSRGGWNYFGSNEIHVVLEASPTAEAAAGFAAHETRHFLQRLTSRTYRKIHEIEAYQWQRAVAWKWTLPTDEDVLGFLRKHPFYRHLPE